MANIQLTKLQALSEGKVIQEATDSKMIELYNDAPKVLHSFAISFNEKPGYWSDIKRSTTIGNIKQAEKELGFTFPIYDQKKIFGSSLHKQEDENDGGPKGIFPQSDANLPKEPIFIVKFNDGTMYLCDGTGAKSYIRFWNKIDTPVQEAKNHMGETEYNTWSGWRAACKKVNPDYKIEGDKDIAQAMVDGKSIGEWDGEKGSVFDDAHKPKKAKVSEQVDESLNLMRKLAGLPLLG